MIASIKYLGTNIEGLVSSSMNGDPSNQVQPLNKIRKSDGQKMHVCTYMHVVHNSVHIHI